MKLMQLAETLLSGMQELSWWAEWRSKRETYTLSTTGDDEAASAVFCNEEEGYVSMDGGEIMILRNDNGTYDVQIFVRTWNNHNGDADSDFADVKTNCTVHEAIRAALTIPIDSELECWSDSLIFNKCS